MKKIKEWDNKPRQMWCWNSEDASDRQKGFVVFFDPCPEKGLFGVCTVEKQEDCNAYTTKWYSYCADIEEIDDRLMTNKQFAKFIKENPAREWMTEPIQPGATVQTIYTYGLGEENKTIDKNIIFREGKGKWQRPVRDLLKDPAKKSYMHIWDPKCEF